MSSNNNTNKYMKKQKYSDKVYQKLKEFDELDSLQPSPEWRQALTIKLKDSKAYSVSNSYTTRLFFISILLFILNTGIALYALNIQSSSSTDRTEILKVISNELFINPVSINN